MIIGKSHSQVQIFCQLIDILVFQIFMKLEVSFVELPHIFVFHHLFKVLLKQNQLRIISTEVWQNRDAVLELKDVRIRSIIN